MVKRGAGPARRVDSNQAEIVAALRDFGLSVIITSALGHGVPDLIVGGPAGHGCRWVEIKSPGGKLTPDEAKWHAEKWTGEPVIIAYSAEDVLRALGWEVS